MKINCEFLEAGKYNIARKEATRFGVKLWGQDWTEESLPDEKDDQLGVNV